MKELSSQQKKDYAQMLDLRENLTRQEIADRVGASRQSVIRWAKDGKWEEMKVGITLTRKEQIANRPRQVAEINRTIAARAEGGRFATPAEADTINKISTAIAKLESDVGIAEIISVGRKFIDWIRPFDVEKSKEYLQLWDSFIKDCL